MYVALAETLRLPLLTDDGKFGATPGHHAEIHHYPD
jgi:predicted nucleic acid-binding protein